MWYSGQLREVMISDTWRKYIRDAGFNNLARVASLCNRAEWEPLPEGIPKPPYTLLNLRSSWDCIVVNDLQDSFGQEWTYEQRKILEYTCHTAFFVSIVIVQVADVMICKTRRNSLFRQGMNNWVLNFGIIFELVVACVVCYAPYMDVILRTYPLLAQWWLPGIPYALIIFTYDELRKLWVRKNPEGWWDRETCY